MPITNAQVVNFANEYCRPLANHLSSAIAEAAEASTTYLARDLSTPIEAAGAGELIVDGSATDGRTPVVGGDIYNLVTLMNDFATFMTQGRRDVLAKWKTKT